MAAETSKSSWRDRLVQASPALLAVVVILAMSLVNPTLRRAAAWDRMSRSYAGIALLAMGLTPVIIAGGIDLSVGSIVGLSAVVVGFLWRHQGLPLALALSGGALTGLVCGCANGLLVLAGISPLVVTLATLGVYRGLAYGVSGAEPVLDFPGTLPEWWEATIAGLPPPLWLAIICFATGYILLHHTWMGRMVYAIGDNRAAARYAAVPVGPLLFALYALSGLLAGFVGVAHVMEFASAPANLGEGLELTAVAAVVLGGVRITGGAGHMAGTLLGIVTLASLLEGMAWVRAQWRPLTTGVFLVVVAILNEGFARWRARREMEQTRDRKVAPPI